MHKLLLVFVFVFAHGACTPEEHDEHHGEEHGSEGGTPSGAECDSTLTYESFGMAFMASYCTSCHSSTLSGVDRNGAPADHDFDSLDGILASADHIDEHAASGPDASNDEMPPSGPSPTAAEREMLGAWLACEAAP
jgi:cytochrome c5